MSAVATMVTGLIPDIITNIIALAGAVAPLVAVAFLITWAFRALKKFGKA